MKKNYFFSAGVILITLFLCSGSIFAAPEAAPVQAGNKFCPVSGDKVGKDFVVHEGKRYGLCCAMCAKEFKKNPKKFIAKMEAQEKSGKPASPGMMMKHAGDEHH